jgi:hypothetical protein
MSFHNFHRTQKFPYIQYPFISSNLFVVFSAAGVAEVSTSAICKFAISAAVCNSLSLAIISGGTIQSIQNFQTKFNFLENLTKVHFF